MVETVCGSSGVLINPPEIMIGMQSLAKKYNIVFILDEVMAGLGRCGEMFAF
jgi:taurine--2-oxoglutarate transaminase